MVTEDPHLFLTAIHRGVFHFHGRLTAFQHMEKGVRAEQGGGDPVEVPGYRTIADDLSHGKRKSEGVMSSPLQEEAPPLVYQ